MKKSTIIHRLVLELIITALTFYNNVFSYDPSPLQDFCVATNHPKEKVYVSGEFCKDPKNVTADDFFCSRIDSPTETSSIWGINGTVVTVEKLRGLNTLGISIAYTEYAVKGISPTQIHPYAAEIISVEKGTLEVGFVTSDLDGNRLFRKTLKNGDLFVVPIGLMHFEANVGSSPAVAIHLHGNQNPGGVFLPNTLFGSSPRINPFVLAKALQLNQEVIEFIEGLPWSIP